MIKFILFGFLLVYVTALDAIDCKNQDHDDWFCDYMQRFNKTYHPSEISMRKRRLATSTDYEFDGVRFGLTSRSDRTKHELKRNNHLMKAMHRKVNRQKEIEHVHLAAPQHLPPIDWRNHNGISYVTPVLEQGDCGCCYAFAATSVLEFWSRKQGEPKPLSVQMSMDCTSGQNRPDEGCEGGLMEYIFEYNKRHPIPLAQYYPYLEQETSCPRTRFYSNVRVKSYKVLMRENHKHAEDELEWILHAYGPVSVGIDSTTMDDYQGGVFKASMCSNEIDHAVTIVGYTESAWIIKNSWGTDWGEDGYLYLERGKNACGIAEYIVYITDATPDHHKYSTFWKY